MAAGRSCTEVTAQQLSISERIGRGNQGLCQAYAMEHGTLHIYWHLQKR